MKNELFNAFLREHDLLQFPACAKHILQRPNLIDNTKLFFFHYNIYHYYEERIRGNNGIGC